MQASSRILFLSLLLASILIPLPGAAEEFEIPGSGNPESILRELAKAFNDQQSEHKVAIPSSVGTAGAIRSVEQGTATLARVGRPLKPEELDMGIVFVPLGRDPVVIVAGADVQVTNITSPQVLAIYRGEITSWEELGGESKPIRAVGREFSDASRNAMSKYMPELADIKYGPGIKVVHLDPQLVELLDRYPTSFGILNKSATLACQSKVVLLGLDGIEATTDNLTKGLYPVWLELGFIYKQGALTAGDRAFLDFIKSSQGVAILRQYGVLPVEAVN